jgi:hypothetical protein
MTSTLSTTWIVTTESPEHEGHDPLVFSDEDAAKACAAMQGEGWFYVRLNKWVKWRVDSDIKSQKHKHEMEKARLEMEMAIKRCAADQDARQRKLDPAQPGYEWSITGSKW